MRPVEGEVTPPYGRLSRSVPIRQRPSAEIRNRKMKTTNKANTNRSSNGHDAAFKAMKHTDKSIRPLEPTADSALELEGSEHFFNVYLKAAEAIPEARVTALRGSVPLFVHNLGIGLSAVLPRKEEAQRLLPNEDWKAIEELPNLSRALIFANARIQTQEDNTQLHADVKEALDLRRVMLSAAGTLAEAKVFKSADVAEIRKGHGLLDAANDCVSLADLFNRHPGSREMTPVTQAQVDRAAALGVSLQTRLKPVQAKEKKPLAPNMKRAAEQRDRMWTLLDARHERLWVVGAVLFGRAVNEHVPGLKARAANVSAKRKATQAQKVADKATARARKAAEKVALKEQKAAERAAKKKTKGRKTAQPA